MRMNVAQDAFIKNHLNPENFNNREVVVETASMFFVLVEYENYIIKADRETFYNLPYKDISNLVFNDKSIEVKSDSFDGFITTVIEEISDTFDIYEVSVSRDHVIACYEKFASHIELALIQKKFMLDAAKEAHRVANLAQKQAEFAKKQAKKAKDMSNNMVTNFVTILGVFATIIITVFGGINIVSSTVKLLEGNNKLVYLVFVISFLMICLLTLLKLLISWITSIRSRDEDSDDGKEPSKKKIDFYTKSISCFLVTVIASAICIAYTHKDQDIRPKQDDSKSNNQNSLFFINTEKPEGKN
ncbi:MULTISPECIES: hypothetical protein [unclassified Acinetobacter]|uniref:hypothetical protein n=1 Tax=unclassified Acinetobacter TaxID=196816 RepID=UPI002934AB0B|nr:MULTISPECIES: hypothetical protein [unclassified Acinetobacter]WOE32746.1 hypothetical protein QSG84_06100 [Acinetobacter sp. SAAs470]WOE38223.1 hypothetical protein QSG86_15155 [Acinetobacter sp. SAAs474]